MKVLPANLNFEKLVQELTAARVKSGAKQEAVARMAGVTRQFVSNVELFRAKLTLDLVFAYIQVCNMDCDSICQRWGLTPPDVQQRMHDPKIWELVRSY